jgi:acetoin utilization deacetylase AcuC-like enzyme
MALVRPPGHHAAPAMCDGYCFFNNVGVAAQAARAAGIERVAIIDWDVHHGNGTQAGFYADPSVLTVSLHMDHGAWGPSHPQTGAVDERGEGDGQGTNLNIPLPMGSGDLTYALAFERFVEPAVRAFAPQLLIIANGLDASQFDPNGRQLLTMNGFNHLAQSARTLADELCAGKLLIVQEGGYNPAYSAFCLHATVEGFIGRPSSVADPLAYMPDFGVRSHADIDALAVNLEDAGWRF